MYTLFHGLHYKDLVSLQKSQKIRPGWINSQSSLIKIYLSDIFLGGSQWKYGILEQKSGLVCGFKKMGWSRNYFMQAVIDEMQPSIA